MNALRRSLTPSSRQFARTFSTTQPAYSAWSPGPAPPRLPKEEQDIFEQLQKQSGGAFSTPRTPPKINQSPDSATDAQTKSSTSSAEGEQTIKANVEKGEELHPNVRRGAPPEFEGNVNPKTGESNGPKTEPLRWGGDVDWSYNGRVTDF